jgi:long-chain acyl-CoA synthetase
MIGISEAIGSAPFRVGDLLDWPAHFYPSRTAIQDTVSVTYAELRKRSIVRSEALADHGVRRFQRWGIIADNSADFFVSLFALARLGAVAAPLQRGRTKGWLSQAADSARLQGVIASDDFQLPSDDVPSYWQPRIADKSVLVFTADSLPDSPIESSCVIDIDPALIIWSSGSTRAPRGVVLQHRAVLSNIRANVRSLSLRDEDRTLVVLPVAHAYALIHQCLCHLSIGATLCCPRQPLLAPSLCRQLEEAEITTLTTVPAMLKILVEGLRVTKRSCQCLRLVTVGAGRVSRETLAEAIDLLPSAQFAITYGLTEAGPRVATNFVDRNQIDPTCIGSPLPNVEIRLRPLKNGSSEIFLRGSAIKRCYADEPWDEGNDSILRTADLGETCDGRFYVRGRLDRSINRGGVLVAPEAIESVLLRHPEVRSAFVKAQPHPFWGEVPAAVVTLQKGSQQTVEDLRRFCSRWLSTVEMPGDFVLTHDTTIGSVKDQKMLALFDKRVSARDPLKEQHGGSESR